MSNSSNRSPEQPQNNSRLTAAAGVFLILSECFKPPDRQFVEQLLAGVVDKELNALYYAAGYEDCPSFQNLVGSFDLMTENYSRCLAGMLPPIVMPVESLYKRWTEDPSAQVAIAASKGYLFGDSAAHIAYLFKEFKLQIPPEYEMQPDHLALLLELLAYMLTGRHYQECRDFMRDHFDWLNDLKQDLSSISGSEFYRYAIKVTQTAVEAELST